MQVAAPHFFETCYDWRSMHIHEALDQLEQLGHVVERTPILVGDHTFYHIDGLPRNEDQILSHLINGTPLHQQ